MTTIYSSVSVSESGVSSSTPDPIIVTQPDTSLVFALDDECVAAWKLVGLTDTDSKQQLGAVTISKGGVSLTVLDVNSEQEDFSLTILVHHRETGQQIGIDPEVKNDPQ